MARHSSSYWKDYPDITTKPTAQDYNDWEAAHDGLAGPLRTYPVFAKYKLTADAPLNNNLNAQLTSWTQVSDKDGVFGSNAWTIPTAGRAWRVRAGLRFGGSTGGGVRFVYLIVNSGAVSTTSILAQDGGAMSTTLAAAGDYFRAEYDGPLNQGDVLRVFAYQTSGAQLTISAATQSATYGDTWFSLHDDGPA